MKAKIPAMFIASPLNPVQFIISLSVPVIVARQGLAP